MLQFRLIVNYCSADPEKWEAADVRRCARWVARKFAVCAPRRHLLPDTGKALLALTEDNWTQVGWTRMSRLGKDISTGKHRLWKPYLTRHKTRKIYLRNIYGFYRVNTLQVTEAHLNTLDPIYYHFLWGEASLTIPILENCFCIKLKSIANAY